jgi:hypothetical protein
LFERMFFPKIRVRYDAADVTAAGPGILCGGIQQIAIGYEVVIRVDPRSCNTRRAKGGRRLRHSQAGIGVGVVARYAGSLEVPAEGRLDCRPARSEHVVRHAHPRRDVLVAVHPTGFGNGDRDWQKSGWSFLLRRKPTMGAIEAQGSLQRHSTERPLLLKEQRVHPARALFTQGEID